MAYTLSFQEAEKIIKENPKQADALAFEYQEFLKTHPEDLLANAPKSVLDGKAISEAYYYLRGQHEDMQMQTNGEVDVLGIPTSLAALPLLAASFLERPKIIQEDKEHQKIENSLKKEWLEKNPGKDFSSKEGLDYLYGRVPLDPLASGVGEEMQAEEDWEANWAKSVNADLPKITTLAEDAEKTFRSNPKLAKRVERYDKETKKVYKKPQDDPLWNKHEYNKNLHINARLEYLEKNLSKKLSKEDLKIFKEEIVRVVQKKSEEEFSAKHPEKAKAYLEKIETERIKQQKKEGEQAQNSSSDIPQGEFIQSKFRPIPEGHPPQQKKEDEGQNIDTKIIRRILREDARSTQQTERFLQRSMGRGTRGLNRAVGNFGRLGGRGAAALGRVGSLAGQLGARAAAAAAPAVVGFFASPPGWIVLGAIALIAVITFLIVRLTGQNVDATQINFQEINSSPMQLSLTPTGTPSAALSSAPTPPEKP